MTDEEILTNLFRAVKEAALREVPLKVLLDHIKTKEKTWAVWQANKVHLVTFFATERKRNLQKKAA
jgi:hypothetical protein